MTTTMTTAQPYLHLVWQPWEPPLFPGELHLYVSFGPTCSYPLFCTIFLSLNLSRLFLYYSYALSLLSLPLP